MPPDWATIVGNLYQYWKPGMAPPSFEDFAEPPSADAPARRRS